MRKKHIVVLRPLDLSCVPDKIRKIPRRLSTIYMWREDGATYRAIGEKMNLSPGRVSELHYLTQKILQQPSEIVWMLELNSLFTANILRKTGFKTKAKVKEALRSGELHPTKIKYLGRKTYGELCNYFQVDPIRYQKESMQPIPLSPGERETIRKIKHVIKHLQLFCEYGTGPLDINVKGKAQDQLDVLYRNLVTKLYFDSCVGKKGLP